METSDVVQESPGGLLARFAETVGVSETGLRLLLSLFGGYPVGLLYRKFLASSCPNAKHAFFIVTGVALGLWNFGVATLHSVFTVLFSYLTILLFRGSVTCVTITFVFNFAYLLIGYYYSSTDQYDINWTLPQCVLMLRLIGTSFDLYDGAQPEAALSAANREVALKARPPLLEYCAHMFFPTSFLIGPQFPLRRYQRFIAGEFGAAENSDRAALRRLIQGLAYMTIFQVLSLWANDEYIMSADFAHACFAKKLFMMGLWGRASLYKYISCWLITEGACNMFGVTYNGVDVHGRPRWDGVSNVDLGKFENCTEFNHYIQSFNINTNHWVAQYVYKRLKFLNNRNVSQLAALVFLAIWHGFHSGYYVTFFMEFVVMLLEKDVHSIAGRHPQVGACFASTPMRILRYALLRAYTFVFMGWCFLPFALLSFGRYWPVLGQVYYVGFWFFVPWTIVYGPLVRVLLRATRPRDEVPRPHED